MSSDGPLSDRDEAVLEAITEEPEASKNGHGVDGDLEDEEYITREEFEAFKSEIRSIIGKLQYQIDADGAVPQGDTLIHKYAAMVNDGQEEQFENQPSLRRAVAMHRNWDEWVQSLGTTGNRREGISTGKKSNRKNQPAEIRVNLEESDAPGDALQANQVQRAMQTLAKKSYQEDEDEITVERDASDRLKIHGGLYRYEQRTSPDNTDDSTKHVVVKDE